jgi:streptogramin lyase
MPKKLRLITPVLSSAFLLLALLGLFARARADLAALEASLNPEGRVYEVNLGAEGRLWISDSGAEEIWALDPATGAYTVYHGGGRVSDARQSADGSVWWVDQEENRLGRLLPESGVAETWEIPGAATLLGTAVDSAGNVWLSQYFNPQFYRFAPAASQVCTYTLAAEGGSDYIVADGTEIWLGDWLNDRIHRLDAVSGLLTSWALPSMTGVSRYPEGLALDDAGNLWWADIEGHYLARLEPEVDRMITYDLPYGSAPHMVAFSGRWLWYSEGQEGTWGRLDPAVAVGTATTIERETETLAPACAVLSPAWTGTLTTTTGMVGWAGAAYTTTVDADGWQIHTLPPEAFPWGVAAREGGVWLVDHGRQVLAQAQDTLSAAACTVADGDGDGNTAGDRTPLQGWTIRLVADGVPVEPGQLTGPSGCVAWDGLEPGVSYGVEVELLPGWAPLGPTSHTFGALVPGEAYVHTFVVAESVTVRACSLSDGDGSILTEDDREPLVDWPVYLHVDGARQEPGEVTGDNGCFTWSDLAPNHSYGTSQVIQAGWRALSPSSYDFGLALPGDAFQGDFVNWEPSSLLYLPQLER